MCKKYITRKITISVTNIILDLFNELRLGILDAKRNWDFSGDYIKAMWFMLQQGEIKDYVIVT